MLLCNVADYVYTSNQISRYYNGFNVYKDQSIVTTLHLYFLTQINIKISLRTFPFRFSGLFQNPFSIETSVASLPALDYTIRLIGLKVSGNLPALLRLSGKGRSRLTINQYKRLGLALKGGERTEAAMKKYCRAVSETFILL